MQGNFRAAVRYPADSTAARATLFVTELPEFTDNKALLALLQSKGVVINATSPSTGTSVLVTLLLSFGPALRCGVTAIPFHRADRCVWSRRFRRLGERARAGGVSLSECARHKEAWV